jgi:F0F1-type ATP synthase delta subunit
MDQVIVLLTALSSPEAAKRKPAEDLFQQGKKQPNPDQLLLSFLQALGTPSIDKALRTQAAVLLRQLVSKTDKAFAFSRVSTENKAGIAQELLRLFVNETDTNIQSKMGEVISRLADALYDTDDTRGHLQPGCPGWPNLVETLFQMTAQGQNEKAVVAAIELLKDLIVPMKDAMVQAQAALGGVIQKGLEGGKLEVQKPVFLLVCEMVGVMEKKDWAPLLATVPVLNNVLIALAKQQRIEDLQECLQSFVEIAEVEPDFFKQSLSQNMEPANTLAGIVKTRDADDSLRNLALEFLVTYTEKKPKWLSKSLPAFAPLAIECCMHMMLEVESTEDELRAWASRMDDEEGEEDADEMFHAGEEAIDRIVEAMDMENVSSSLFPLVARFSNESSWQAKLAALAAVKQTVEYAEDEDHISQMAQLLLAHVDHPHPRVRYTALHAIGQLANDQAPHFQEKSHKEVMPVLLNKMDDQVDRVASMAMSAFVSFGEELDTAFMLTYAPPFMEKLVQKLSTSNHRMVKEESITSIAVIAGVIENDFSLYYDSIMPILKQLIVAATGEKESRLRGKAFECMSLLGIAVGKDKFLPDAKEAVEHMLKKVPNDADELQREYIKEASERICKCLKQDFAFFLPHLLPNIFQNLKLDSTDHADDDDDNYLRIQTGDGKVVRVHSSKFEELQNSVQLLTTFCSEMEGAYFDFIKPTAEHLMPLLTASDSQTLLCDEARSAAYQCWALLIKCAEKGREAGKQPANLSDELLQAVLPKICTTMKDETDPDSIRECAEGLSECLKYGRKDSLGRDVFAQIFEMTMQLMDASLTRTSQSIVEKKKEAAGAPAELQADEDDEEDEDEEEQCRRALEEVFGSMMELAPAIFAEALPKCEEKIRLWMSEEKTKTIALFLVCDLLEKMKERSVPLWPTMIPAIFPCLTHAKAEIRIPACYAVNLAAPLNQFAEATPKALEELSKILGAPVPKGRKEKAKARMALDNAVAATLALAVHRPGECGAGLARMFELVLGKLPLKEDEEEAKKVHEIVVSQCLANNAALLGPENKNLPVLLKALAEMYKQENICEKETDAKIVQVIKSLPQAVLEGAASQFSEKQIKKIQNICKA